MSKLFYILLALFCFACDEPPTESRIKGLKNVGSIDDYHKIVSYHDDDRGTTCYVVVPRYDSQSYSISCVKDEMAPPR